MSTQRTERTGVGGRGVLMRCSRWHRMRHVEPTECPRTGCELEHLRYVCRLRVGLGSCGETRTVPPLCRETGRNRSSDGAE